MAALAWIFSIGSFLGGLALWQDLPSPLAQHLTALLMAASLLCCPLPWRHPVMAGFLTGRMRLMACLAMLMALPLLFFPVG